VPVILRPRPPFDWPHLLEWTASRAVAGLEIVDAEGYRRVVDDGRIAGVASDGTAVDVRGDVEPESVRRVLDLDHDPAALAAAFGVDPILGPRLARAPGIRVPGAWSGFEIAVRAILGQQVSVAGARRTAAKLVETLGEPAIVPAPGLTHRFPTPATVADGPLPGMPQARGRALRALAAAVRDGLALDPPADPVHARAALLELPGIGPWTAEYVAMRALRDRDAWPSGDLWLRRAAAGADPDAWRPWRAYAAMLLWQVPLDHDVARERRNDDP
jgi:AraC family transcriptional regulator, regulatory protein of adaptative response / DNA-3-methyladenine glycosylase II